MAKQNVDYGYDIQKLYLEMLLSDAETFSRCQSIFDSSLFDKKLQPSAEFIHNYVLEYNALPTYEMVNAVSGVKYENTGQLQQEHLEWLMAEIETFIRHKGLERAILQASDLLEEGDYGPVEDMIKKAIQVGLTKDIGLNYWENPKERLLALKDNNGQIKTGWDALDHELYGGMNFGELNIFCGCSGAGKSLMLANLGINFAIAGQNVVYLTFELSEKLVGMRMDSMISGTSSRNIFRDVDNVHTKVIMTSKKAGSYQIKYMPSGKNVNDIRSYLKEYEIRTGKKVDVLIIDYLDLMMPVSVKVSPSDLFIKDKYVSEELRNLAMEKKVICLSASQLNRCISLDTLVEVNGEKITINKVKVGDYLTSNNGPVKVLEILPITRQPVFEITTKSGKKIKCSAEHKFPTSDGLKTINTGLKAGDKLQIKI